jgi:hypothetical protein
MIHLAKFFIAIVAGLAAAVLIVIVLYKVCFSSNNRPGTLIGLIPPPVARAALSSNFRIDERSDAKTGE